MRTRRKTNKAYEIVGYGFHCAAAAAVAAGIAFTALMGAMYHVCSASGTTCGLIATPVKALLSVGPASVIAAVAGWIRAARRMRREAT